MMSRGFGILLSTAVFLLDSHPCVQSFAPLSLHQQQRKSTLVPSLNFELRAALSYLDSLSIPVQHLIGTEEQLDDRKDDDTLWKAPSSVSDSSIIRIDPMTWDGQQIAENAFRVNLPPLLLIELRSYADRMGITDMYRQLVVEGRPLPAGGERAVEFRRDNSDIHCINDDGDINKGYNWMVQRPKSHWKSNMHWTSPADETAHDDYLRVLSKGGFDQVLQAVGDYFELDAISAYHLSFIGVSHCEKGFIHADVNDSGRSAFNMIIPLMLQEQDEDEGHASTSTGELEILSDDETITRFYKYEYNAASMVGDHALHATAACDYRHQENKSHHGRGMRLAATVYIGDITPTNVNHLLMSLTQVYPPVGDAQHLLDRAGSHWSRTNPDKKLPCLVI